jgi:hypothetical protein
LKLLYLSQGSKKTTSSNICKEYRFISWDFLGCVNFAICGRKSLITAASEASEYSGNDQEVVTVNHPSQEDQTMSDPTASLGKEHR